MLDFYFIKDDQSTPSFPEKLGLKFAGDLDDRTFYNLQNKGIIDKKLDYYSDFRLDRMTIEKMSQNILIKDLQSDSDVKKLSQLLETAEREKSGLIAYGD